MQFGAATVENIIGFHQKIKNKTAYDPAIPVLGIYLKEHWTQIWKNECASVFIAGLFTIIKICKQPKFPSVDEEVKNAVKGILFSGILKKKEILPFVAA